MPETDTGARPASASATAERADRFRRLADSQIDDSYRLASFILGSPEDARDAVHDAFISAWRRWPSLRDQDKFDSWFKSIVVNACRDRLRSASRRRTADQDRRPTASAPDAFGEVHDKMLIEQALAQLRPDDQIALGLRYYHDLKLAEIAAILDVPVGTVKSRLNHARSRLRTAIERLEREEGHR